MERLNELKLFIPIKCHYYGSRHEISLQGLKGYQALFIKLKHNIFIQQVAQGSGNPGEIFYESSVESSMSKVVEIKWKEPLC